MTSYEDGYFARANRLLCLVLALHLPALPLLALAHGNSGLTAAAAVLLLLAAPVALVWRRPSWLGTSITNAVALLGLSALTIAITNGRVEYHFHVFVSLALLVSLADLRPLLAAAGAIAVQHVATWWWSPSLLLNYQAAFGDVLIHAVFVVLEVGPCCWIAQQLRTAIRARGIVHQHLEQGAREVYEEASQIASFTSELSRGAATQTASVDQVSAMGQRMDADLNEAHAVVEQADQSAQQLVRQAGAVEASLELMAEETQAITAASHKIAGIAKVIDGIAFQTNILALNAAVEAARAGEAGQGFAVVADEVRNLAQRAAQAARDVEQVLAESLNRSEAGSRRLDALRQTVADMSGATTGVSMLVDQVRHVSGRQRESVSAISSSLRSISEATHAADASSRASSASGEKLSLVADRLQATVDELKALG